MAVVLDTNITEQLQLRLEEVDMAFFILQKFFKQSHRDEVFFLTTDIARAHIKIACAEFSLEVAFQNFLGVPINQQRRNVLQLGWPSMKMKRSTFVSACCVSSIESSRHFLASFFKP